jgi:hypothetical protein
MGLTYPQPVILYQVGDLVEQCQFSLNHIIAVNMLKYYTVVGANNWLDAVDASYCGGEDPTQASGQFFFSSLASPHSRDFYPPRMVYIQIKRPVVSMVGIPSKTWFLNAIDNEYEYRNNRDPVLWNR